MEVVTKQGFLNKQGEIVQSWKKRWFLLQARKLSYYKDEKMSGKPLGVISLNHYRVKKVTNKDFCPRPNAFVLLPKDKYERAYLIHADSEKEMNEWIQSLLKVTADAGQQILSAAVEATKEEMKNFEENRQQKRLSSGSGTPPQTSYAPLPTETTPATPASPSTNPVRRRQHLLTSHRSDRSMSVVEKESPKVSPKNLERVKSAEDVVEDYDDDDSPWESLDKALQYAEEIEGRTTTRSSTTSSTSSEKTPTTNTTSSETKEEIKEEPKKDEIVIAEQPLKEDKPTEETQSTPVDEKKEEPHKQEDVPKAEEYVPPKSDEPKAEPYKQKDVPKNEEAVKVETTEDSVKTEETNELDNNKQEEVVLPKVEEETKEEEKLHKQEDDVSKNEETVKDEKIEETVKTEDIKSIEEESSSDAKEDAPIVESEVKVESQVEQSTTEPITITETIIIEESTSQPETQVETNDEPNIVVMTQTIDPNVGAQLLENNSFNAHVIDAQLSNPHVMDAHLLNNLILNNSHHLVADTQHVVDSHMMHHVDSHLMNSHVVDPVPIDGHLVDSHLINSHHIVDAHLTNSHVMDAPQSTPEPKEPESVPTFQQVQVEMPPIQESVAISKTFSWREFLLDGFDEKSADEHAKIFVENELSEDDVKDLDHDLLKSMGFSVAKTRLTILKIKAKWCKE